MCEGRSDDCVVLRSMAGGKPWLCVWTLVALWAWNSGSCTILCLSQYEEIDISMVDEAVNEDREGEGVGENSVVA